MNIDNDNDIKTLLDIFVDNNDISENSSDCDS